MNYRHAFHAGNHADVLKHLVLVNLLEALNRKDSVTLVGFGTFVQRHRGARAGKNPQTGEPVTIKQMGNVMKVANAKAAGSADGKRLSTAVKAALN